MTERDDEPRVLDASGALVTVTTAAPTATSALELCGELPTWQQPIAMRRVGAMWQARIRAAPGVHEVKLRAPGGRWFVDPAWRTVASDDRDGDNGVLVIGGTDEPVLHAPAAPWLERRDDGRVVVRAALRRTAGAALALVADGERRAMRPVGGDASHRWFEAELAGAGRELEYAFELADHRVIAGAAGAFRIAIRALAAPPPAWWRDAVVYTIFVDRFRRPGGWTDGCASERDARCGGDLHGVIEALPHLAELGVTALHLTPICVAGSVHRYDAIDPTLVDPALGGDAALAALLDAAHARGMRVLLDVAATHVHRSFAPFRDVVAHGPRSPYWRWFRIHRWPFIEGQDPGYEHYQKGQWEEPLLALDEPEVGDQIVEWFAAWARRGADGLRVDAAADLPVPLLARIRAAVHAVDADAIVFGEVVPAGLQRFAPCALDAATDFAHREALIGWLGGGDGEALVTTAARQRWRGAGSRGLGFTGTHDQPRIRTVLGDAARSRLGLAMVALGARVPLLYYGDEVGLAADAAAARRAFEDAWPDRQPMPWDPAVWDRATLEAVSAALALRAAEPILRRGDEELVALGPETLLLRRRYHDDAIDIVVHRGDAASAVALPEGPAAVRWQLGGARLDGGDAPLAMMAACSLAVIDRRAPAALALVEANTEIATAAYERGSSECPAYPVRLYLTVTEACNLRCAHCITDAPARTRAGTARTLQPWLLDALDDAFAHAAYVAFTHGGESVTAPIFDDVLRRIRTARAGRSGRLDIHLVSNGMLLDAERVARLADLGVTSLMISLDGATPATNDRIRVLGRLDRVVAHVAAALELRARRGLDLRLGISTVVGATTVRELPALARLCRDLGVDWLKLEETYPATPFARRDLLAPDAPELVAAVAEVRELLASGPRPVVLVDHLAPPAGCSCHGDPDPAAIAFRAADDFANRFQYRACRVAWEQVAIDPDGTVHLGDYAGPVLGSLLDAPLLALWNAAPALAARRR